MFNFFQKIGKALMTPIAVLTIAAILLRLGFGDIFTGEIANIMKVAGEAVSHLCKHGVDIGVPEDKPSPQRLANVNGQDQQG